MAAKNDILYQVGPYVKEMWVLTSTVKILQTYWPGLREYFKVERHLKKGHMGGNGGHLKTFAAKSDILSQIFEKNQSLTSKHEILQTCWPWFREFLKIES